MADRLYPDEFIRSHEICECGDFRHQHTAEKCMVCGPGMASYSPDPCKHFRWAGDANSVVLAEQWPLWNKRASGNG